MRINNITLSTFSDGEDVMRLIFRDSNMKEPYVVKTVGGLDATDIIANFSGFGANSTPFFDMSLAKRTIILRLGLNPTFRNNRSHSNLRDELYRLIALDRSGKIRVHFCMNNDKLAFVDGKVTKIETNHFELGPEGQITIESKPGILRSPTINEIDVGTFGREFIITDCISTAPHGLAFKAEFLENTSEFIMQGADTVFSLRRAEALGQPGFNVGDILHVSSEGDDLYVRLKRQTDTSPISIIENVEGFRGSQWPMIYPGRNSFNLITNAKITELNYREAFWGI